MHLEERGRGLGAGVINQFQKGLGWTRDMGKKLGVLFWHRLLSGTGSLRPGSVAANCGATIAVSGRLLTRSCRSVNTLWKSLSNLASFNSVVSGAGWESKTSGVDPSGLLPKCLGKGADRSIGGLK